MRGLLLLGFLVAMGGSALSKEPRGTTIVEFYGPHPIDPGVHSGLCGIEGPHMHSYRPHDEVLYVTDGPYYTFVGDPTEFEQPPVSYSYYGHHPVWWTHDPGEHYCYITGPHHHGYEPPHSDDYTERGGAYWYVGARPVWYERHKARGHRIDDHYHDHVIVRPVITVEPPSGWIGVTIGIGGIGVEVGRPVHVIERPTTIIYEHDHHDHRGPPAWGHHKDDPHFPGKHGRGNGKHGKGKGHK